MERTERALREQKKRDDERIQKLERDLAEVRRRLDQLLRMRYGRTKSEQLSREQLELMLVGLPAVIEEPMVEAPAAKPAAPARPRHPRRALDDEHLPTRETVIEPVEVSADPQGWTRLG